MQWNEVLSLGEQQRLGMARLMVHQPRYAVLDECTSGVTTDMELRFTDILKRLGCTCITISHRPALVAFHDLVLALDGDGGWQLLPGQRRRGAGGAAAAPEAQAAGGADDSRAADARFVNAMMAGQGAKTAAEEEGGARRTVLAAVLQQPGMSLAEEASAELHARLIRDRLAPVRLGVSAEVPRTQQWRHVARVLFAGRSPLQLAWQFSGIGTIVLLRTLLQARPRLCVELYVMRVAPVSEPSPTL